MYKQSKNSKMTIDLGQLTRIYVHRTLPTADDYSFKLVSQYSQKDITEDFNIIYIEHNNHNNWSEISFAVLDLDPNSDYNGYYELNVGYITAGGSFVSLEKNLVKVVYNISENVVYQSDNENNEQYVYYRK